MLARSAFWKFSSAVNYYKLFNIPANFTEQELKASYLQLVKQYHPDLSKEPNSAQMFRIIQEGYATLSDTSARLKYQSAQQATDAGQTENDDIVEIMRKRFYKGYQRNDPVNDQFNFSHKLFKDHYEQMEQPKAEYQKFEGQYQSYYARKDEKGQNIWKQVGAGSAALLIVAAAYYYTNR